MTTFLKTVPWCWVLPPVLLGGLLALLLTVNPARLLNVNAPPLESLTVERTVLNQDGITLQVRAEGSEPMQLAQVQIDGAYWAFTQRPPRSPATIGNGNRPNSLSLGRGRGPSPYVAHKHGHHV